MIDNSNYYEFRKGDVAKLNDDTKRDLRAHHFKLGHMQYGPDKKNAFTEANSTYLPKTTSNDVRQEFLKTKEESMKSTRLFEDEKKYYSSSYGDQFGHQTHRA